MSLMITTLSPHRLGDGPGAARPALQRLSCWLRRRIEAVGRECAMRRARRELSAMPDSLLRDIGIGRGEIEGAVTTGRITRP